MAPVLARYYGPPRGKQAPPVISRRTAGPMLAFVGAGVALLAAGTSAWGDVCLAFASVLAAALISPLVRQQSLSRSGPLAEVLFAAPFVLFFAPFVIWFVLDSHPWHFRIGAIALAIGIAIAFQFLTVSEWKSGFDADLLKLVGPLPLPTAGLRSYQLCAAAVGQELFYRGVVFTLLAPVISAGVIGVAAALFVLEHVANRWSGQAHAIGYHVRLFLFSSALGAIVWSTGSLAAAVAGHLAFNLFPVAQLAYHHVVARPAHLTTQTAP